jgi:prepilin-type N-terminal cleavage/methylation domain-containing protein
MSMNESPESQIENGSTKTDDGGGGIFRGFTLIELMLVIAIISILTAIAFISMLHYELVLRVNASARDLGGQMRMVRAAAIRDGRSYLFSFGTDGFAYGVDFDESGGFDGTSKVRTLQSGITWGYREGTPQVPEHPYPVACAIYIGNACGGNKEIWFRRDGTIASQNTGGADGVAYMIPARDISGTGARNDRERAVDWMASSGRVRVWKPTGSSPWWR